MHQSISTQKRAFAVVALGLVALALFMLALSSGSAQAASAYGSPSSGGTVTPEPTVTPTPRPIKLRPWVQFGRAEVDGIARYQKLLFNHLSEDTTVNLSVESLQGWNTVISPTTVVALPGYVNQIHIGVHVPITPEHRIDIERVRAVTDVANPFTTTAYLVTIAHRRNFTDLDQDNYADGPVQYLAEMGVLVGYGDGSFRPNAPVTRAQFAKMVVMAMQWPLITPQTPTFSDIPASFWAYSYIETAHAQGIINGYGDGTFRPGNIVTRAQVAKMIYLARHWTTVEGIVNFIDVQQGDWFYTYAQAAGVSEIMGGYPDGSFRPNAPATRAQVAKILALSLFSEPTN